MVRVLSQGFGALANLALAGQEHQHISATALRGDLVERVDHGLGQIDIVRIFIIFVERPIDHVNRV